MSKISLIIQREYLTRVKKKSFIIMTILGPLLMSAIIFARVWLGSLPEDIQHIQVVDESMLFHGRMENHKNLIFTHSNQSIEEAKASFYKNTYNIILYIPKNIVEAQTVQMFYKKQPPLNAQEYIRNTIKNQVEELKLIASGIDRLQLDLIKTKITLNTSKLEQSGEQQRKNTELSIAIGFAASFLIYLFIFLYGAQVMRGVIEEKTNRIVEVIISSVKPFQLMMGKIIGIALVGLTQFMLWVLLTMSLVTLAGNIMAKKKYDPANLQQTMTEQTFRNSMPVNGGTMPANGAVPEMPKEGLDMFLSMINLPVILGCFLFYFLGGYLLYGALFAAIGSAVDSDSDTQQFMLPITIPMILAITMSQVIITNPESSLAFWFSIIPLTSPVVMMVRIPFGVPYFELFLSMSMLVLGFILATWISAKVYRTGILMYGKKNSWKELWKWLFYSR
jgi:ABC-2 type transport system permease protein